MQGRGYAFEKTLRKTARDFAFIQKLSKETGVSEDKLWRKTPVGGGGAPGQGGAPVAGGPKTIPEGATGVVMPGPDGQPHIVPLDQLPGGEGEPPAEGNNPMPQGPVIDPPYVPRGVPPMQELDQSVDTLPIQNPGLSRNRDLPYSR
jgi:hypothetical protein